MGIPKVIHYCWFGGNPKSDLINTCMQSWKEFCPEYEIIEWNENNFDLNICPYVKEAYEAKKWAFVSDYVRIWVLNKFGGVYLDTDVEIKKNLNCFLEHKAFTGFETKDLPFTAVFGCEKGHPLTEKILDSYAERHFIQQDGFFDMQTNTKFVSDFFVTQYGIELNNTFQKTEDGVAIYPNEFFCPKSHADNMVRLTEHTYAIHWFDGSWMDVAVKKRHEKIQKYNRVFGEKIVSDVFGVFSCLKKDGLVNYIKKRI